MGARSGRGSASAVKSGIIIPHEPRLLQRVAAWLLWAAITLVSKTLRYRWIDQAGYFEKPANGPAIYSAWHNRLALCLPIYREFAQPRHRSPGMAAMASASRDGAFLSAVLRRFGVEPARGSSSRRGRQALLELTSWAERGYDLAITPDGPRGPKYIVQPGVISLAQVTGLPILPCTYNLAWKFTVRSWDRFQVPLPFSRCDVLIGPPIHVPRDTTDAQREDLRRQLEEALLRISKD